VGGGPLSDSGIHHFVVHHSAKGFSAINFSAKAESELFRNFRFWVCFRFRGRLPLFDPCPGSAIRALSIWTGSSRIRENSEVAVVAGPPEISPNSHEFGYAQLQSRFVRPKRFVPTSFQFARYQTMLAIDRCMLASRLFDLVARTCQPLPPVIVELLSFAFDLVADRQTQRQLHVGPCPGP
jgi:hypothetical protein